MILSDDCMTESWVARKKCTPRLIMDAQLISEVNEIKIGI